MFIEHLLYAKYYTHVISFNFHSNSSLFSELKKLGSSER